MSDLGRKAVEGRLPSNSDGDDPSEHTPLLIPKGSSHATTAANTRLPAFSDAGEDENTNASARAIDDDDRPLPMLQIFVLSCARVVEPFVFFSIFPFVNQMIADIGSVAEEDVGFYSGLIESIFGFTQIFSMLFWGRIADRFGYKKVLLISLLGQAITAAMFGLATSVAEMIIYRCLAGIFGGTVVTVRVLFTLHSTPKTEARAFSFFALGSNIAVFLGPFVGGLLAQPATQFPRIPKLFHVYPYFLPTLVTGLYALSAAIVAALWLEEPRIVEKRKVLGSATNADGVEQDLNSNEPLSYKQILKSKGVILAFTVYGLVSMLAIGNTAIAPLWWFTPMPLGGLGLTPRQISLMQGTIGFSQAFWMVVVFPPLHRRLGTIGLMRLCAVASPTGFVIMPITQLFMRRHAEEAVFWTCTLFLLAFSSGISMSLTGAQLLLNAVSPSYHALGTLNGIALSLMSAIRAASPVIFSTIFAIGVRERILSGNLIWIPLISVGVILRFMLLERWIPENVRKRDELVMKGGSAKGVHSAEAEGLAEEGQSLIESSSKRPESKTVASSRQADFAGE